MAESTGEARLRVSRRGFLKAGGVSAALAAGMGGAVGAVPFRASRAFAQPRWDEEYDVVVVGSGAAGFVAGITARALGSETIILEKGAYIGGSVPPRPNVDYMDHFAEAVPTRRARRRFGWTLT